MFFFPKLLFGNAAETRAAWSELVDLSKCDFGQFGMKLDTLELVDIACYPGAIVLWDCMDGKRGSDEGKKHWRLNYVSGVFANWLLLSPDLGGSETPCTLDNCSGLASIDAAMSLQQQIILRGCSQLWFCVAMLCPNVNGPAFACERKGNRDFFHVPLLRRMIYWLPEIMALRTRFFFGSGGDFLDALFTEGNPRCLMMWWRILHLVESLRPDLGFEEMSQKRIPVDYHGNVINALLGQGVIQKSGTRFSLCEG